jgi:hypothetical protein
LFDQKEERLSFFVLVTCLLLLIDGRCAGLFDRQEEGCFGALVQFGVLVFWCLCAPVFLCFLCLPVLRARAPLRSVLVLPMPTLEIRSILVRWSQDLFFFESSDPPLPNAATIVSELSWFKASLQLVRLGRFFWMMVLDVGFSLV